MTRALASALTLLALAAGPAFSEEPPPPTEVTATRLPDGKVELKVGFEGGACEAPTEALVISADADETMDSVTIPTVSTAEVCTMQIVQLNYEGVIAVERFTTRLSVTVLNTEGQPRAFATVDIAPLGGEGGSAETPSSEGDPAADGALPSAE